MRIKLDLIKLVEQAKNDVEKHPPNVNRWFCCWVYVSFRTLLHKTELLLQNIYLNCSLQIPKMFFDINLYHEENVYKLIPCNIFSAPLAFIAFVANVIRRRK